ncbi:MAG: FmdB family zinc ribbon protein [Frankiaceae bacterium]
MPTYQYACTACDERLEVVQRFSDEPLTECPACQGRLRKVFSAVGVVFKGSGFYQTDSRAAASSGAKSGEATSDAKPEGKPDAKPDAKSEGSSATKPDAKPESSSTAKPQRAKTATGDSKVA